MNGGTKTERAPKNSLPKRLPKVGQVAFGVVYAALFFFLFLIKPAPEQRLRASIGIAASQEEVSRLLQTSTPIYTLPADRVAPLLLTAKESTDISFSTPASSAIVLTVETT